MYLYNIKTYILNYDSKFDYSKIYNENHSFKNEPTKEDCFSLIKFLRPSAQFSEMELEIKFIRNLKEKEL